MISKTTWTSSNLESAFARQTSSFGASCKKEQKKEIDPNGMPKTQMPSKGQQKLTGGEKPRDKLEGDHSNTCGVGPRTLQKPTKK
jgi:hypothetical protein